MIPGMSDPTPSRRAILQSTATLAALAALGAADSPDASPLTAAVIGHTGRGDYGHGLDTVFNDLPGVRLVALADPDPAGRAKAAERTKAPRPYADYREMLDKEKPALVSVAPRHSDQHHAMATAALAAGAHVIMEKPITPTLAEADDLLAAADRAGKKIAVAHQMRLAPVVLALKRTLDAGRIGDLLRLGAWGKQDSRAGGEDMLVLGSHLFDLMRFFAGDARWCTARVLQQGRDITPSDARTVAEQIGPVAGDEIDAQFAFDNGVIATFTSRGKMREQTGHWGLQFTGSKGSARLLADIAPRAFVMEPTPWTDAGRTEQWQPFTPKALPASGDTTAANRRVATDWLAAIRENRDPACSARAAMKSLEMIMAVYHAALSGARVQLPLKDRSHPLKTT
jgi:predicted dehydrogenase